MCLGIPGKIIKITDAKRRLGLMDVMGVQREINLACIDKNHDLKSLVGEWALVHVGFAMSLIDESEANKTLEVMKMLGEAQEKLSAMRASE